MEKSCYYVLEDWKWWIITELINVATSAIDGQLLALFAAFILWQRLQQHETNNDFPKTTNSTFRHCATAKVSFFFLLHSPFKIGKRPEISEKLAEIFRAKKFVIENNQYHISTQRFKVFQERGYVFNVLRVFFRLFGKIKRFTLLCMHGEVLILDQ